MGKKTQPISTSSLPLVAIDLGSDSIRAMAATRVSEDLFEVLGVEQSRKFPCVEHGVVTNTANAGYMIGEVLRLLANRIRVKELPSAFVTIGGEGMRIVQVTSKRDKGRKQAVTLDLIEDMKRECKEKIERNYNTISVLGIVPAYFVLDQVEQDTLPTKDQEATVIEAHFIAFYGKKELETRLEKSFDQCGRVIEQTFVRPDALVSAFACADGTEVLTNGCAVLDLGAQTTTLSIYKGSVYIYNETVARGSDSITRAIEYMGVNKATAEQLKTQFGCAMPSLVETNKRLSVSANGSQISITTESLAQLIKDKLDEILIPLLSKLNKEANRISTLYITGGGSMLYGIDQYIQSLTSVPVVYGAHDRLLVDDTDPQYFEPTYASLVGTLLLGSDYRATHSPVVVKRSIMGKLNEELLSLFSGNEDDTKK